MCTLQNKIFPLVKLQVATSDLSISMVMEKLKKTLSGEDDEERGIVTKVLDASTLSWETRIKDFLICFVLGALLTVLGSIFIFLNKLTIFAVLYSIGSVVALSSTCFLMGPVNQFKKMFAETRIIATIVVLICIILTLVLAFTLKKGGGICLIFVIIQFLAMTWYSISYIPFARDAIKKCVGSCIS